MRRRTSAARRPTPRRSIPRCSTTVGPPSPTGAIMASMRSVASCTVAFPRGSLNPHASR